MHLIATSWGPSLTWFDFNTNMVKQLYPLYVWGEITYLFPNFDDAAVEVWEWMNNLTHILLGMW